MLVEYLAFRRFPVAEARSGAEALDVARRVQPNIILMDLSMPGVDGWEATRRLRADPATKGMIIVGVTAHAFPREQEAARAAGCDVVIAKPFDLTALTDAWRPSPRMVWLHSVRQQVPSHRDPNL
jgi:CheY-like chemotaxis protein